MKKNEISRACGTRGRGVKVYKVLVGKSEGKGPLGRPRPRWESGSELILGGLAEGGVESIQLAKNRDRYRAIVNAVMNFRILAPRN
jgi:hypothetical protein